MRRVFFQRLLLLLALLLPVPSIFAQESYWPTEGWRTSTPEEQGIDSEMLVHLLHYLQSKDFNVNSVLIIRHGYVVLDTYIAPYSPGELHIIHSATKSFVSTLVGIAIQEGAIDSVDTPVSALLPDWMPSAPDEDKQTITLEDLLTMQSGLGCQDSYQNNWRDMVRMQQSSNWVQFMADLPMAAEPGTVFNYCNGITYLLGRIVSDQTGTPLIEYAEEKLFEPLNITNYTWTADSATGELISWGGLLITPPDMAKLGYLMLHNGEWDGQQLVSPEWVAAATAQHADTGTAFGGSGSGYGYQWWIEADPDHYSARGFAGQYIFVVPQQDMVVVVTSGLGPSEYQIPQLLLESFILPSIESDKPLPGNPTANTELTRLVDELSNPTPQPVPSLPPIASAVSGKTYTLAENSYGISTIAVQFEEGAAEMTLVVGFLNQPILVPLPVGLDGRYRTMSQPEGNFSLKGYWRNENTFLITLKTMSAPTDLVISLKFTDDNALVMMLREAVNDTIERIEGHANQLP